MSGRPFVARRSRRCAMPVCSLGGRIRPGDLAVRKHRTYVHSACLSSLPALFAEIRVNLQPLIDALNALGRNVREYVASLAQPPPPEAP